MSRNGFSGKGRVFFLWNKTFKRRFFFFLTILQPVYLKTCDLGPVGRLRPVDNPVPALWSFHRGANWPIVISVAKHKNSLIRKCEHLVPYHFFIKCIPSKKKKKSSGTLSLGIKTPQFGNHYCSGWRSTQSKNTTRNSFAMIRFQANPRNVDWV